MKSGVMERGKSFLESDIVRNEIFEFQDHRRGKHYDEVDNLEKDNVEHAGKICRDER